MASKSTIAASTHHSHEGAPPVSDEVGCTAAVDVGVTVGPAVVCVLVCVVVCVLVWVLVCVLVDVTV
jgi:hypothetical protein